MTDHPDRLVADTFAAVLGHPCWQVRRGHGSFLTLEFGTPSLEIREPRPAGTATSERVQRLFARRRVTVRGQWHLWIYCCAWAVTVDGEAVGDSESTASIDRAAAALDGQKLLHVRRGPGPGAWCFEFDLGACLTTWPHDDAEQWFLYAEDGTVTTADATGLITRESGDSEAPAGPG